MPKPPGWLLPAEPYEAQRVAFNHASGRDKFGWFLEQGLGKSLVQCADFARQAYLDQVVGLIVLAPSYLKSTWRDEWNKWQMPFPLFTWPDVPPDGDRRLREPHGMVFNYDSILYSGGDYIEERLKSGVPYALSADESRAIGNPSGHWNKRAMYLRTLATQLRALCGQPWTNTVLDLYPQLRWCGAINGMNPYSFRNRFARLGGFMGRQIIGVQDDRMEELQQIINSCSVRLLKKDYWADMPEKVFPAPLEFEMSKRQDRMYREVYTEYCTALPDQPEDGEELIYAAHAANMFQKLQQISRGFVIDNEGRAQEIVTPKENPALRVTRAAIENTTGKVVVPAFHTYSVGMLSEALKDFGCVTLRGGMADREIEAAKAAFNEDNSVKVLVGQMTVTARGHTLLGTEAQRCSTEVLFENTFDADIRMQIEDRIHRYGQDRACVYLDLRGSPMDDRMVRAFQKKISPVRAVLDAVRQVPAG